MHILALVPLTPLPRRSTPCVCQADGVGELRPVRFHSRIGFCCVRGRIEVWFRPLGKHRSLLWIIIPCLGGRPSPPGLVRHEYRLARDGEHAERRRRRPDEEEALVSLGKAQAVAELAVDQGEEDGLRGRGLAFAVGPVAEDEA